MMRNTWYILILLWCGIEWHSTAATVVIRGESSFVFGEWSAPEQLVVKSSGGTTELVRRVCQVEERYRGLSRPHEVQVLFNSVTKEVWLGEPVQDYLVLGGKIWGVRLTGRALCVLRAISDSDSEANRTGDRD
jgi:hypothetical protein